MQVLLGMEIFMGFEYSCVEGSILHGIYIYQNSEMTNYFSIFSKCSPHGSHWSQESESSNY